MARQLLSDLILFGHKHHKFFTVVAILAISIFVLSACGRRQNNQDETATRATATGAQLVHSVHTLTISTSMFDEPRVRQAAANVQASLGLGQVLDINIVYYMFGDEEAHYTLMLSQLAAGVGPDIISWGVVSPMQYRFVEYGFLADIYELIDQSQTASRGDFFTNALQPFEVGGQLLAMPMHFGFEYVGINENAPSSITQRFAMLSYATPSALAELYLDLIEQYPEWMEYAFIFGISAYEVALTEFHQGVDFASRQVNLGGLTPVLDNLRTVFADNDRFGTTHAMLSDEFLVALRERYVFVNLFVPVEALFDYYPSYFAHYIPRASEDSRLVQRGFSGANMSITNNAEPELAWAFLQEYMNLSALDNHRFVTCAPITQHHFPLAVTRGLRNALAGQRYRTPVGFADVDAVTEKLQAYSNMPTTAPSGFLLPFGVGGVALNEFLESEATAQEATARIEAEILEWLTAERSALPTYVIIEPVDTSHFPVRTLTFLGSGRHAPVAEQAAAAMNASWRTQQRPYVFELDVDTFDEFDFEKMDARYTQLITQLMAGQGPDIFVYCWGYDINALARSGFLMDFYTLIENCPRTSLDDFYTQPLKAFERAGGLYMFPTNFDFHYVTINTNLPHSILDMYTQHEFITLEQMLDIYLALVTNYPDEFGHMIIGYGNEIWSLIEIIEHVMSNFIDLNARTSDLTNPEFVSFLKTVLDVAGEHDVFDIFRIWGSFIDPRFQVQFDMVNSAVFFIHSHGGNSSNTAHNFFTSYLTHFYHSRPLVNNSGELVLSGWTGRWGNAIWSTLGVTAAGDYNLAWEFIYYLIHAYTNPVGRAAGQFGGNFGANNLGTPILRNMFERHTLQAIDLHMSAQMDMRPPRYNEYVGLSNPIERQRQTAAVIERIAVLNEMPMAMQCADLPLGLVRDMSSYFRGVITPQEWAQRTQNAVSLWLIE